MKKIYTLIVLLFFSFQIFSQSQNRPVGANFSAIGNAGVSLSDVWSVYHNQAGLAQLKTFGIGINFENKYGIKELSHSALALALPTKTGTFGLSYSFFGYSKYNESKIGLAYAKQLFEKFSAGIQLDYFTTNIYGDYGRGGLLTAEIGIIYQPITDLKIGAHAFNPVRSSYNTFDDENLSTSIKLGASYNFSELVLFSFEVESDLENTTNFKSGIQYQAVENLYLRIGINTKPVTYHFGFGYHFQKVFADIAFSHHEILGYSTNISLQYAF